MVVVMTASPPPVTDSRDPEPCRCGHAPAAHEHYRQGSDCSQCDVCPRYRPASRLRLWWRRRQKASAVIAARRGSAGSR